MSDQTRGALDLATARAEAARVASDRLGQELLERIASGIPARIDGIAKRTAESQPEVTKQLGSEGIRTMRAELADKAGALATEVRGAARAISWPSEQSLRYGEVRTRHLDGALFSYLHGGRMNVFAEVLESHGFAIYGDSAARAQDVVNPHQLYSEQWLSDLADARTALSAAQAQVRDAQRTDDESSVQTIWDGS
jgi:hypothetical protein